MHLWHDAEYRTIAFHSVAKSGRTEYKRHQRQNRLIIHATTKNALYAILSLDNRIGYMIIPVQHKTVLQAIIVCISDKKKQSIGLLFIPILFGFSSIFFSSAMK